MKKILVTGGSGYIGSHTCVELIQTERYTPIVIDNLSNSSVIALDRVEQITGQRPEFYQGDIRNAALLEEIFSTHKIYAVIHFAGLKAVGESVEKPLIYYENNIAGSINLFSVMKKCDVKRIVFSSSATVYGDPASVPIQEHFPLSATNAYGRSKLFIEEILRDINHANKDWDVALLRYFNPVGAHESGLIGEDPSGIPNNLMPYISRVAMGQYETLSVFGDDYDTPDGTGVRDYIHVVDLAKGHVKALDAFEYEGKERLFTVNLGTGQGYSVLEMAHAFSQAADKEVAYKIVERRAGDIATCYADPALAISFLGWKAEKNLQQMCDDTWNWQQKNPNGYKS